MTKRDIIIFIFKWSKGLFGYWFLIIGLSVLVVYAVPQKYEAVAKILIESNRAPVMRADMAFGVEQLSVLNSEVAIIRSNPVFAATADRIEAINKREIAKLAKAANQESAIKEVRSGSILELFRKLGQWMVKVGLREQSSPREGLIRQLQTGLKIAPQPNSNVIAISYTSDDPQMAATIVNTITEKYINHHLKIFSSLGISEVYRLQIARMEDDLKTRRDELADYKRDKSVTALIETKRAQVQRQTQLTADLSNIERDLAELLTRFGKGHTKVVLAEERLLSTQQSLDEISEKLQSLEIEEAVIRNMEIEINSIELTIQSYKKLFQDEQMINLANPEVVNVLIIEEAVAPTGPTHSRLYYIVLATIGGFLLSFAIAFIREYFDHRVTDPKVAAQLLGVPTLGSIEKA
ncbi:MAG: hypothetical protein OEQ39_20585 [Gammaproteobacteria bacterium]|nr:hypothetical protein [Gammaproteobacteria bacterium]